MPELLLDITILSYSPHIHLIFLGPLANVQYGHEQIRVSIPSPMEYVTDFLDIL